MNGAHGTAAPSERRLHLETVVQATSAELWPLWTTDEGVRKWLVEGSRVECRVGGPFELFFHGSAEAGERGSEGCTVLSYLPREMLSFTWNFPPTIPELRRAGAHTFVVVRFASEPGRSTRVLLDQLGWHEGTDWSAGFEYFDRAWRQVLQALQDHLAQRRTEGS